MESFQKRVSIRKRVYSMTESQAKKMLKAWQYMGYSGTWEQTGGGVHLVYLEHSSGQGFTVIGSDSICRYTNQADYVNGVGAVETIYL